MRVCRSVLWLFSPLRRTTAPNHGSTVAHAYEDSELKLYNSLTRRKEVFTPLSPPTVTWYCCGPTVYDAAHMGHARSYITFDILRRVLSDYFGYRINYVMNITDIDDKIIKRARHTHLLDNYTKNFPSLCNLVHDITAAMQLFTEKVRSETDPDKRGTLQGVMERVTLGLQRTREDSDGSSNSDQVASLISVAAEPLSDWLDARLGSEVRDKNIFASLSQQFEEEFHSDMEALNVLPPDVLTRVSEYVPEVVEYIQHIIARGFAYETCGSVYFDVDKFSSSPHHTYAKLLPEVVGDLTALAEGEGELSTTDHGEKKRPIDFALWKASKAGEPAWPSPWGEGRPGWHIECSVMACEILGERADIHSGGVDLKYPHHDNEIAQVEARYGSDQWMSYFLHCGLLTIAGHKMSKSLNNFITIKQALEKYSSQQLRLAFLLHSRLATIDYSEDTMKEAQHFEKMFNEFFLTVKDLLSKQPLGAASYLKFSHRDKELLSRLNVTQASVHSALCDSVNTHQAMYIMKELVNASNIYLTDRSAPPNARLLHNVASYLTGMLQVFGVIPERGFLGFPITQKDTADKVTDDMPFLTLITQFREEVRKRALELKDPVLLSVCDDIRDRRLGDLGVRMEDKEEGTVVKVVGRDAIDKEREAKRKAKEERLTYTAEQRRKLEETRCLQKVQPAIPPQQMFLSQTDKYSAFDDQGIPSHDESGEPLSRKKVKRLRRLWLAQERKYQGHLSKE